MNVTPIRTQAIHPRQYSVTQVLDDALTELAEQSIVVITSKIVSLCEGRTLPIGETDKEALMHHEADLYYVPEDTSGNMPFYYTIVNNTFTFAAGIDTSNADGNYVLWPKDPFASASAIRQYLRERFSVQEVGVIIADSTILPSRWGVTGIAIAHCGFAATKTYYEVPDVFGHTMTSKANVAGGIAAAAVLVMGEGAEQTPIAVVGELPSVKFQDHDPTPKEIAAYYVSPRDDRSFAPFFNAVEWHPGHES